MSGRRCAKQRADVTDAFHALIAQGTERPEHRRTVLTLGRLPRSTEEPFCQRDTVLDSGQSLGADRFRRSCSRLRKSTYALSTVSMRQVAAPYSKIRLRQASLDEWPAFGADPDARIRRRRKRATRSSGSPASPDRPSRRPAKLASGDARLAAGTREAIEFARSDGRHPRRARQRQHEKKTAWCWVVE